MGKINISDCELCIFFIIVLCSSMSVQMKIKAMKSLLFFLVLLTTQIQQVIDKIYICIPELATKHTVFVENPFFKEPLTKEQSPF